MSVTGTAGDILPLIAIGRRLARQGHQTTLLSHEPFRAWAEKAGVSFIPMDTAEEYERLLDASASLVGRSYDLDAVNDAVGWYHTPCRREREFSAVVEHAGARQAAVVARYVSNPVAVAAGEAIGAGRAWSLVSPHALAEAVSISILHPDRYTDDLNRGRAEFGLPAVPNWYDWLSTIAIRMSMWTDWFAPDTVAEPNSELVGFAVELGESSPLPPSLWDFLGSGGPPVLVTAGTGKMVAPGFHTAAVGGCLRMDRRVVLVGKYLPARPAWPSHLVHSLPHAPLVSLLRHVSAVIHHGGIGTCAQALTAGVPQLLLAEGVDRPDNAERLRALGVAESLPASLWRPAVVASALTRLTAPMIGEHTATCSRRMREADPVARGADLVARLVTANERIST